MPQHSIDIAAPHQPDTAGAEIRDLIGQPPGWLLQSGIGMLAIVVGTLLACTTLIDYPDKIEAAGVLTSATPPIELVAPTGGYITELVQLAGDTIVADAPLLYMRTTTDHQQIHQLQKWLSAYRDVDRVVDYLKLDLPDDLQVGTAQTSYARLQRSYADLRQSLRDDLVWQQIAGLRTEITHLEELGRSQERSLAIYEQELDLIEADYGRQTTLHDQGVISTIDHEAAYARLLQAQRQAENFATAIIQNDLTVHNKTQEITRMEGERRSIVAQLQLTVNELIMTVSEDLLRWREEYSVVAPIAGTIQYMPDIVVDKPVAAGQVIGHILPGDQSRHYIIARCPTDNAGKIEIGQRALIRFAAYPHKEYGTVQTTVTSMDVLPTPEGDQPPAYDVKIALSDTIVTDYGYTIPYRPQMTASVTIVTEDRSLFDRVFDQLTSLLKSNRPTPPTKSQKSQ